MKALVEHTQRQAKMRAHTATHLLHFMLHQIISGGTKQAGSLVDNDLLRFDFSAKQPLSQNEIIQINEGINAYIYASIPVDVQEMSFAEAQKTGAKAFFEDKYGDTVRVVRIQNDTTILAPLASIELCGGTHVVNTADIGAFRIISQESVASGVRRITAYTGTKVAHAYQDLTETLDTIAGQLDCTPKQISEKLEKTLKEFTHIKQDHASLQGTIVASHLDELDACTATSTESFGCRINTTGTPLEHHTFKEVITQAKQKRSDKDRIIYNQEGNFAVYGGSGTISAKEFAKEHTLKGGGSDTLVQGRDENIGKILS